MKPLSAEKTSEIILKATALNAEGKHHEAIDLIESNLEQLDPHLKIDALKEVLKAAEAVSHLPKARKAAKEIARKFPDLPCIQSYLE